MWRCHTRSGSESVGVARQWCGRLGKIDNCQVGIYMGYATSREHALVDMRLYLPKEWTKDRKRRKKAGTPKEVRYRTRHQLCLEMLKKHGDELPHTWISGDDEMGRPYWFRRRLNELTERYLLAIPSNTLVRDLHIDPPEYSGRGRWPKRPWTRVDRWTQSLDDKDWTAIEVHDGAKWPIIVEAVKRQVVGRANNTGQEGHEEVLVVNRHLVFGEGNPSGKKNTHRRLRFHNCARPSLVSCENSADAILPFAWPPNARSD